MLKDVRLYRRHNTQCNNTNSGNLKEDVLDRCQCNLGYKGTDPTTGKFRRLMFDPPIKEIRVAWRTLDDFEQGKPVTVKVEQIRERLVVRDAFEKYLDLVRQRNVKESSIYHMFRPVGNAIVKLADQKGLSYIDEIQESFGPDLMGTFQHLSVNVRGEYRKYFQDFARIATKHKWTSINLAERIETPARGKGRTAPVTPTEPFDLDSELPKIMEAIPGLTFRGENRKNPSPWRVHPDTAKALLLVLRFTGLRFSDSLLFEPRSLERKTVTDGNGKAHEVYVRWIRQQKKTDAPVFIVIPLEVGEFICRAPRLSAENAFIPSHVQVNRWAGNTATVIFPVLEAASGVKHIHAHRFRDTFAIELYRKTKDMAFVSRALGHKSVVVTMNHYSHFLQKEQDEAIKKMLVGWGNSSAVPGVFPTLQTPDQSLHG